MPITFNSAGGFLNGTISSSNGDIFITTSGSVGSINVGNVEYTGSQVIEKDSAGKVRNKKTFNADGTITQEKFDQNEKITETKVKNPSTGKETARSGSAISNQIEFQQNSSGAFITVSGSIPGYNIVKTGATNDFRTIRQTKDFFYSNNNAIFTIGVDGVNDNTWFVNSTSAEYADSNSVLRVSASGDVFVKGNIHAQEFHTELISSSIIFQSGSTIFGNSHDDTHQFTGKFVNAITASGNISSSGDVIADRFIVPLTGESAIVGLGESSGVLTLGFANNITTQIGKNTTSPLLVKGNITASGNISGSATSTGSFGHIKISGTNIKTFISSSAAADGFGGGGGAVSAVANGANNRVATFSSADALNGEANLTFDGSTFVVNGRNKFGTTGGISSTSHQFYGQSGDDNFFLMADADGEEIMKGEGSVGNGDLKFSFGDNAAAGNGTFFQVDEGNNKFILKNDSNNSKVGINTTAPTKELTVKGDISASGEYLGNQIQIYNANFQDDLGTTTHYVPIGTNNFEQTTEDADEVGFVAPYDGELVKIIYRHNFDASSTTTRWTYVVFPDGTDLNATPTNRFRATVTGATTDDIKEITVSDADGASLDDMFFNKGETIVLSIRNSADVTDTSSEFHVTVVLKFKIPSGLI